MGLMGNRLRGLRCGFVGLVLMAVAAMAVGQPASDDLSKVLSKLDSAAGKFKSAQAEITWDNVQTKPFPDTDSQAGTVVFEKSGGQLEMALHLKTPVVKDMVYADGIFELYEPRLNQMQVFKAGANRAQYDMFLTVGFGGSGKELEKNWDVSYSGTELVEGVSAAKLTLVPRDTNLTKTVPKVLLWVNLENGVAVKQQSFDTAGNYRVVTYHNVKLNGKMPGGSFKIKTAPGTQVVNR